MLGACPGCGLTGDLDIFCTDAEWKRCIDLVRKLPREVQRWSLEYLRLFNPEKRTLTAKKAFKVLAELRALVEQGAVRWEHNEERPTTPALWAEAIEAAITREPPLRGIKNHNYIRHTVWSKAAPGASRAEARREQAVRHREHVQESPDGENMVSIKELFDGIREMYSDKE